MATGRKIALALLAAAWMAFGVALLGVFHMPRCYCNELPTPPGQVVTVVGLLVGGSAAVLGTFIESARDCSLVESLVAVAIGSVTIAAGVGVWIVAAHHVASWGCG